MAVMVEPRKPKGRKAAKPPKAPAKGAPASEWPARLKALRAKLNLTQVQFAKRIAASPRIVAYWEVGDRPPTPPFVMLIELLERGVI
jgi:DNA-binding transcriptional regulator YiaG